jgi:hypothetical protein
MPALLMCTAQWANLCVPIMLMILVVKPASSWPFRVPLHPRAPVPLLRPDYPLLAIDTCSPTRLEWGTAPVSVHANNVRFGTGMAMMQ